MMAEAWKRKHSNGWFGWVEREPKLGGRYVASAAPASKSRSGSHYKTADLAKAASDHAVRRQSGHTCSSECEEWHEG